MELIDTTKPEVAKAIDLAKQLVEHCNTHNFEANAQFFGVAINAGCLEHEAYMRGKNDEKNRITTLLGLST